MSDLTAAIEAAKRLAVQEYDGEFLIGPNGEKWSQSIDGHYVGRDYLRLTSQPLYRRRKAEWVHHQNAVGESYQWAGYGVHSGTYNGRFGWLAIKYDSNFQKHFEKSELAQAACEEHFWAELEASVLERIQ